MSPILITWQDAVSEDSWEELSEAINTELHTIYTLGFLIYEDETRYVVAHNFDIDRDACSQHIAIPKSWVLDIKMIDVE